MNRECERSIRAYQRTTSSHCRTCKPGMSTKSEPSEVQPSTAGFLRPRQRTPLEISDRVIDFLSDDKVALRQCSLVCRDWLPRSSHHLFASFSWPPCYHGWLDRGWDYGPECCRCSSLDDSNFWSEFLRFLDESQRVRAHIRDRKSTRLNSSHSGEARMPSSA